MKIIEIVRDGRVNHLWAEKLYAFCEERVVGRTDKGGNYTRERLDLAGHLAFHALVVEDQIISFCGVYNGGRYPKGVHRILNRAYTDPDFRGKSLKVKLLNSQILVPRQIADFRDQLDFVFISVEGFHSPGFFQKIIAQFKIDGISWVIPQEMIKVANCEKKACYQSVAYASLWGSGSLPLAQISREDYLKLD